MLRHRDIETTRSERDESRDKLVRKVIHIFESEFRCHIHRRSDVIALVDEIMDRNNIFPLHNPSNFCYVIVSDSPSEWERVRKDLSEAKVQAEWCEPYFGKRDRVYRISIGSISSFPIEDATRCLGEESGREVMLFNKLPLSLRSVIESKDRIWIYGK